jgi:hypothetical protein
MSKHEDGSSSDSNKDALYGALLGSAKELEVDRQVDEKLQAIEELLFEDMDPDHVREYKRQYNNLITDWQKGVKPREGALLLRVFDIVQFNYFHELGCLEFEPPRLRIGYTEGEKLLQADMT